MKNEELRLVIKKLIRGSLEGTFFSVVLDPAGEDISHSRDFNVGDDPRKIETLATFESGHAILFEKNVEIGANVYFLIDGSASLFFSSVGPAKFDYAVELVASISQACLGEGNRFSLLLFTDHKEYESGLIGNSIDLGQKLYELRRTKMKSRVSYLKKILRTFYLDFQDSRFNQPSLVFIVSDFLFPADFEPELRQLSEAGDVIAIILRDPAELLLPGPRFGLVQLVDPETGQKFIARRSANPLDKIATILKRCEVDWLEVNTGMDTGMNLENLIKLFEQRKET